IPSCQTFPGAVGDFIASALNVYVGSWMEAAGPSQVELTVLDRFRSWMGLPVGAAGVLAHLGIVCFRRRFDCDEDEVAALNAALVGELEATGEAVVRVGTRLVRARRPGLHDHHNGEPTQSPTPARAAAARSRSTRSVPCLCSKRCLLSRRSGSRTS